MDIATEFIANISLRFNGAFNRIEHALNQLDDIQIWYRPSNNSNSIGILLQHLEGVLNQWIISTVGGEYFVRNRPQEFIESEQTSKVTFLEKFAELRQKIINILSQLKQDDLLIQKQVPGFGQQTIIGSILAGETHLELHTGQILYIAKIILGDKYILSWKPAAEKQVI